MQQVEPEVKAGASAGNSLNLMRHIRALWVWLLILSVLAAALWAAFNSGGDPAATLRIFSTRFLGIFIEAAPFLLMGTVVSGLLEVFVSKEDILRLTPRNPILATIFGAFLGFAFPVCECGVVPVTRRLFTKGLPMSVGVAFLLAAPVVNPIVLVSTYIAFGWGTVLIARFVITIVVAIAIGVLFALTARPQDVLRPVTMSAVPLGAGGGVGFTAVPARSTLSVRQRLYNGLRIGSDEFFDMGRFLVLGCLMAASMQTFISQDVLLAIGEGPLVSVIVMQALAFVLSVCSTVDSFLALAFYGTFTGGSVVAFLTFGPMVDIKSAMMFLGIFKRRVVFYLILLPFLMTMLIGLWMNLFVQF